MLLLGYLTRCSSISQKTNLRVEVNTHCHDVAFHDLLKGEVPPATALQVWGTCQIKDAAVHLMAAPSAWLSIHFEQDVAGFACIYCKLCPPESEAQAFTSAFAEGLHSNSHAQSWLRISASVLMQAVPP